MTPIRNLGGVGVITDLNPYDLPSNAVSRAVNCRFKKGKLRKAPAFRSIIQLTYDVDANDTIPAFDITPGFAYDFKYPGNADLIMVVNDDGRIFRFNNDAISEMTAGGFSGSSSDVPFTHTVLSGVSYLNRSNMIPQFLTGSGSAYADLTNWTSNHRCRALRGFRDYLIALDVTKGATRYPTMVKWSNNALFDAVPDSWDETDTTKNAGENTLGDATSAWLDGCALGNQFFLYNDSQVFRVIETGDNNIFDFKKRYDNRGIINTNCVVEARGLHYVFDTTDIYVHDGVQDRSIVDGKVKEFIFDGIDLASKDAFFVYFNPNKNTVHFCYKSADELVAFPNATKCNRAAVYDISDGTWSFDDMPNAVGWAYANIDTFRTYEDVTTSYEETGGTYNESSTGDSQHFFVAGLLDTADGLTVSKLYGQDSIVGGLLPYEVDQDATKPAIAYRIGIDMDEDGTDIRTNKVLRGFYPQMEDFDLGGIQVKFVGTMFNVDPDPADWTALASFDPSEQYHLNPNVSGRYLGWYLTCSALTDFTFSGFDADVVSTAHR